MLKGHLDTLLLASLESGPRHGYAVKEALRAGSGARFDLAMVIGEFTRQAQIGAPPGCCWPPGPPWAPAGGPLAADVYGLSRTRPKAWRLST